MTNPAYDKAKWHYGGTYPDDLPDSQAYIHIGLFLTWLLDHDMCSQEFHDEFTQEIAAVKRRHMTGPQLLRRADGALVADMLNEEGNAFSRYYYKLGASSGGYFADYEAALGAALATLYHVEDTWTNYERLSVIVDRRYEDWKSSGSPQQSGTAPVPAPLSPPRYAWRRRYVLYLVLGKAAPLHAYDWAVWQEVARSLDPIVATLQSKVSVRSTQLQRAPAKPVSFGPLSWNDQSHMRWTHGSPLTKRTSDEWCFFNTEVWAPHWKVCAREDRAPDLFVDVKAEYQAEGKPFDQAVLIAVPEDAPPAVVTHDLPQAAHRIAAMCHSVLTATTTAQWGRPTSGGAGYTDALEDFAEWGLHQARHAQTVPDIALLPGEWQQLSVRSS